MPLSAGLALVNGYTGEHPVRRIEAAAVAPYRSPAIFSSPASGYPTRLLRSWRSEQSYHFSKLVELTTRFQFPVGSNVAKVEVLTFCSLGQPQPVCQEVWVECDTAAEIALRSIVDARNVDGIAVRELRETPGEKEPACDGALLWESAGGLSICGLAYVTALLAARRGAGQ